MRMLIFDAHLDLAWNALDWNRDLRLPAADIRQREIEQRHDRQGPRRSTVSFPELRRGKVGIFIATLLARLLRPNLMPAIQRYESMEAAYAAAYGQLAYYRALEQQGYLRWIKDAPTLKTHVAAWQNGDARTEPLGFILSMEGADPVLSPEQVEEWWNAGLRIIGPAHYGVSPYAHGTGTEGGLFPHGPALLKEMERVGMILDVTHLSDQCFDEALDIYGGPVLASHHNCRALVPDQRQLTDDQIKRLIGTRRGHRRGPRHLDAGAGLGPRQDDAAGNRRDAGTRWSITSTASASWPATPATPPSAPTSTAASAASNRRCDLDTIADLQRVPDLLRKRGYNGGRHRGHHARQLGALLPRSVESKCSKCFLICPFPIHMLRLSDAPKVDAAQSPGAAEARQATCNRPPSGAHTVT